MVVMLLNVKIHILVKVKVLADSLIPEGLQLGAKMRSWSRQLVVRQGGVCAGSGTLDVHSWSC